MDKQKIDQPKALKVKGTGIFEGDNFTFKPAEQGEPTQKNVRTTKGGKLYETTSETKPLQVAHLSCPANAADPWQEYTSQLERLGVKPKTPQQLPQKQRLVSEGGMEIFLDAKECQLTYQGSINLNQHKNWQSEVMRQLQLIVRTLPGDEKFKKVMNKIKKGGIG